VCLSRRGRCQVHSVWGASMARRLLRLLQVSCAAIRTWVSHGRRQYSVSKLLQGRLAKTSYWWWRSSAERRRADDDDDDEEKEASSLCGLESKVDVRQRLSCSSLTLSRYRSFHAHRCVFLRIWTGAADPLPLWPRAPVGVVKSSASASGGFHFPDTLPELCFQTPLQGNFRLRPPRILRNPHLGTLR